MGIKKNNFSYNNKARKIILALIVFIGTYCTFN